MNERRGWFDDDRNLVVVAIAEPIERHSTYFDLSLAFRSARRPD
jgi:hypothetical protein